jgi:hypothetical protein
MEHVFSDVANWLVVNFINMNTEKTDEMVMGSIAEYPPLQLTLFGFCTDRVTKFKQLGITTVLAAFAGEEHVDSVIFLRANKRPCLLRKLNRSAMAPVDLLHFLYTSN